MMIEGKPLRILHVVGQIAGGGVGTWLMHVLRHIDRQRFKMDFLVYAPEPPDVETEVRALGGNIIVGASPYKPWAFAHDLKRILKQYGPYNVVHSHAHHYSGYVLRLSSRAGVPMLIAHSHMDLSPYQVKAGFFRQIYLVLMNRWLKIYTTKSLSTSRLAAADLFGNNWQSNSQVLYCGMDFSPFKEKVDKPGVRRELRIPPDTVVVGHVGRFVEQKNHAFLVKIAAELARRAPQILLLLIGEGPLRPAIEQQVSQSGLENLVIFGGLRRDVPRLMLGDMDVFLFPSHYEGLGLALVEAQAAGLPCVISDAIPEEADVVPALVQRLSLSQPAGVWAEAVLAARNNVALTQPEALAIVERSPFNISASVKEIERIYAGDG